MCVHRRLRSAWASTQSDQSSLSALRTFGPLTSYWAHSEDWSDWADAHADLSLRWAHVNFLVLSCGGSILCGFTFFLSFSLCQWWTVIDCCTPLRDPQSVVTHSNLKLYKIIIYFSWIALSNINWIMIKIIVILSIIRNMWWWYEILNII